jgi:hypothetical protein
MSIGRNGRAKSDGPYVTESCYLIHERENALGTFAVISKFRRVEIELLNAIKLSRFSLYRWSVFEQQIGDRL